MPQHFRLEIMWTMENYRGLIFQCSLEFERCQSNSQRTTKHMTPEGYATSGAHGVHDCRQTELCGGNWVRGVHCDSKDLKFIIRPSANNSFIIHQSRRNSLV